MSQAIAEPVEVKPKPAKADLPIIIVEVKWSGRLEMFDAEHRMVTAALRERFEPGFIKSITPPMPRREDYMPDDVYEKLVNEWAKSKPDESALYPLKVFHGTTDMEQGFYAIRGEDVLTRPVLRNTAEPVMKLSHNVRILNPGSKPFFTLEEAKEHLATLAR